MTGDDASDPSAEFIAMLRERDLFDVIERIHADPDPERVAATLGQMAQRLRNQKKSVSESVVIARAGIQFCLCHPCDPAQRLALRAKAKALSFNLAANTWPGWGDEGVLFSAADLEAGMDAARLNLRLARELDKDPLIESRAHWIVGAHLLARAEYDAARDELSKARELAHRAADGDNERMNAGYAALIGTIRGEAPARDEFLGTVTELQDSTTEDGKFFAEQLVTALEVFTTRESDRPGAP